MNVEILADYACNTGEGPSWHPDEQAVYWTDIPAGKLFRYDVKTGAHEQVYEGRSVGGMTIQPDGSMLLFRDKGNVVQWKGGKELATLIEAVPELESTRFNDVIADPEGRVYAGTMSSKEIAGRLYRMDRDGSLHVLLTEQGTPNGMGFSPDRKTFYYQDSRQQKLFAFDYDRATGNLTNERVLRDGDARGDRGRNDGMTVDAQGNIWSARWDGGCVLKFSPAGELLDTVDMPAKKISSCQFGGADFAELYLTSAGGHLKDTDGEHAGALFRIRPGVAGVTEFRSRIAVH